MSQQVSTLFFFCAFNTVFWMPLSMLNVFYCFAHPERGTAGALINGWERWAGCCCGFHGRFSSAEPVPVSRTRDGVPVCAGWGPWLCGTGREVAAPPRARWHRGTEPAEQAGLQKWLNKPCKSEPRKELPTEKAILEDKCNLRI